MALLTTYANILGSVALLTIVFYVLESLIPADVSQKFADRLGNWIYLPLITFWVCVLQLLLTPWYALFLDFSNGGVLTRVQAGNTSIAMQIALAIVFAVLWDVWQYWIHRWQHTSPFLWETHKFHHSDTAMNASSQARHHAVSYVLYFVSYAPMLLIFGAFAPHAIVSIAMFRVWGFVNHANVRIGFGPLMMLLASPQWHRIHHSTRREHYDMNFATLFPFIDRLFGTYYAPARDEYPPTGLPEQQESMVRQATISPFATWFAALTRRSAIKQEQM